MTFNALRGRIVAALDLSLGYPPGVKTTEMQHKALQASLETIINRAFRFYPSETQILQEGDSRADSIRNSLMCDLPSAIYAHTLGLPPHVAPAMTELAKVCVSKVFLESLCPQEEASRIAA